MSNRLLSILIPIAATLVLSVPAWAVFPCCKKKTCQCAHKAVALPEQPMRLSEWAQQLRPNRVLVVVPLDRQDRLKEQVELKRRLARELRSQAGFDVIEASERVCEDTYPIRTGQFDERKLLDLGKKYLADTVMYCNIESIDAYCPMRVEMQFLMVNVDQSVAIVSGTRQFDLADKNTQTVFYKAMHANPLIDTTLKNSPTRLIEFGAARLAGDLSNIWR